MEKEQEQVCKYCGNKAEFTLDDMCVDCSDEEYAEAKRRRLEQDQV